jgi:hypothetical protein
MQKKQDKQTQKNTKEMSSDEVKVKGQHQTPPPEGPGERSKDGTKTDSSDAEAQKGHA